MHLTVNRCRQSLMQWRNISLQQYIIKYHNATCSHKTICDDSSKLKDPDWFPAEWSENLDLTCITTLLHIGASINLAGRRLIARFGFRLFQSAATLSRCLSNVRTIRSSKHPISWHRDTRFDGKTSYRLVNTWPMPSSFVVEMGHMSTGETSLQPIIIVQLNKIIVKVQ